MSLVTTDGSTDRIEHGTSLGGFTAASWALWFYPVGSLVGGTLSTLWSGSFNVPGILSGTSVGAEDELRLTWRRGAGGANLAYETNNAGITADKWWYLVVTVDQGAGAGVKVNFYVGDLSTLAVLKTLGTATDPSSGYLSNTGATFTTGDNGTDSESGAYRFASMMFWPGVVLTLAQVQRQQFSRVPMVAGCSLYSHYGYAAAGATQPDYSGVGNHGTETGCAVGDHVPLPFRRVGQLYVHYEVAAAPGGSILPFVARDMASPVDMQDMRG